MTTLNEARNIIYTEFEDKWAGKTPAVFQNEPYKAADDETYVRLVIRTADGGQETSGEKGNRRYDRAAYIFAQVFVPENTGTSQADTLSEELKAIFESNTFDGVVCNNGNIDPVGVTGKHFQTNVDIAFKYYEIK